MPPASDQNASNPMQPRGEITRLLHKASSGNRAAFDELVPLVYEELHKIAASRLSIERPGHTLTPTALVHEAYLRARFARAVFVRGRPAESASLYRSALDAMASAGMRPASMRETRLRMAETLIALKRTVEADSVIAIAADSGATVSQRALIDSLRAALRR